MHINDKIKQFITANILYGTDGFPYADDASFLQEGILDSLGFMELVTFVEKEYRIVVPPADVVPRNFDSVSNVSRYLTARLNDPAGIASPNVYSNGSTSGEHLAAA